MHTVIYIYNSVTFIPYILYVFMLFFSLCAAASQNIHLFRGFLYQRAPLKGPILYCFSINFTQLSEVQQHCIWDALPQTQPAVWKSLYWEQLFLCLHL